MNDVPNNEVLLEGEKKMTSAGETRKERNIREEEKRRTASSTTTEKNIKERNRKGIEHDCQVLSPVFQVEGKREIEGEMK